MAEYAFGDSESAARRLELLARVFDPSTRSFVREAGAGRRGLAVDLGCGPGFTTRLLADELECESILGLDTSVPFICHARANARGRIAFEVHDVLDSPFPCGPAEPMFCRFLLTHLRNPADTIARWSAQLDPGGILLIQETEAIETRHPLFMQYLRIVAEMLQSQSKHLYAGPAVNELRLPSLQRIRSDLRQVRVSNAHAAEMFRLNLETWQDNEFVRTNYSTNSIRRMIRELSAATESQPAISEITWLIRQMTLSR